VTDDDPCFATTTHHNNKSSSSSRMLLPTNPRADSRTHRSLCKCRRLDHPQFCPEMQPLCCNTPLLEKHLDRRLSRSRSPSQWSARWSVMTPMQDSLTW
jgi:hypothetical protein